MGDLAEKVMPIASGAHDCEDAAPKDGGIRDMDRREKAFRGPLQWVRNALFPARVISFLKETQTKRWGGDA
jgi:hypothetical protein